MSSKMKVLTVCQPYASLIMGGTKRVENRTWATQYRGPLLIHAGRAKTWMGEGPPPPDTVFGALLGQTYLLACLPIEEIRQGLHDSIYPWLKEHEHAHGPVCWVLGSPNPLAEPIPRKGLQGIRDYPGDATELKYTKGLTDKVIGSRVGALRNTTDEEAFLFGYGTYLGELEPPFGPFGSSKEEHDEAISGLKREGLVSLDYRYTNPCIQLDDGRLVWGAQCWWGTEEQIRARVGNRKVVIVK